MNLRKRAVLRILLGCLLLFLAMAIAFIIKEVLSARNPEKALPRMQITVGELLLADKHSVTYAYSWRFLLNKLEEHSTPDTLAEEVLPAAMVPPNEPLYIGFSYEASSLKISRADGNISSFYEISPSSALRTAGKNTSGLLYTPSLPGVYTYRVEASWWMRGSVEYYFRIDVRAP